MTDLPSQWTHQPQQVLRFRAGDRIADIDTDASPGFTFGQPTGTARRKQLLVLGLRQR
jgi:hypothetical protein